ncbi:CRISPR-associated protein [Aetokthonos hydrillicola Thurmond2011]|jgi:putative CRISPR-associated protein (TIGR02619 family)|uniref:CRISPR-associated protein n=1 Tax=Aetokthonos hydrillicola Thurmond2011 TaxID=2712845 RepID=A0AAP5I872_9CYAN|nr:CRISPR-associated protein [Aetokthonos hydrillicola]MBO3460355.1 CRISPR-associated protein [Aetokthonos hydrillicola CCALA 1050]MBW4588379.1 CRISPR-associated protein [Aetokthonos hydrillicola CCALA 1050]MDR9896489.1 CRISPR-associated protein [Aetokthonos hydrillicola Thurmond2011]
MRRVILSTIGTSLLTNQINRANPDEKDWYSHLRDTANLNEQKTPENVKNLISILKQRADAQLSSAKIPQIRRASAELNGIYGVYQEDFSQGKEDYHFLIATDTIQGKTTAQIVEDFLRKQGLNNISIYAPPGLSTASTEDFSTGIDDLIVWLQKTIPSFKANKYKIYFNLVGSFKSLQGYLNTIGMFYADEIIYIFEGEKSDLITIPRLPISVDTSLIQPHTMQLALLDAGAGLSRQETTGIPETMLAEVDGKMTLSTWGQLIWNQCKDDLLSGDLIPFARLEYQDTFRADYNKVKEKHKRVKLQETLATVTRLLDESNGDTAILKQHGGIQYDRYVNMNNIDHFRVTQGIRVSNTVAHGKLILRRYGLEPDVNNSP